MCSLNAMEIQCRYLHQSHRGKKKVKNMEMSLNSKQKYFPLKPSLTSLLRGRRWKRILLNNRIVDQIDYTLKMDIVEILDYGNLFIFYCMPSTEYKGNNAFVDIFSSANAK